MNLQQQWQKCTPKLLLLWCIFLTALFPIFAHAHPAAAQDRFLDLSFDRALQLSGEWQFYPKQLLTSPPKATGQRVELPNDFKTLTGSNQQYGTFVGHFRIPSHFVGRRLAIQVPDQPAAYRIHLDGKLFLKSGQVSPHQQALSLERATRIAYFIPQQEQFSLTIQVSSHQYLHGGLERPIKIGFARYMDRQFQTYMMSIGMVCGAVLGMGLFTILFSLFRGVQVKYSKSIFMFGLFIVFLALHNLFAAPHAYTFFTDIDWLWGTRLEYLFSLAAIGFFLTYMHGMHSRYLHRWVYSFFMLLITVNVALVCLLQPDMFEWIAKLCSLSGILLLLNFAYGFQQTLKYKQPFSYWNLVAVIFLVLTFINDLLLMFGLIDFIHLSFISTSLYALLIMFQQSRNYALQAFYTEQLNSELLQLNDSLDHKVKARTQQLHALNEQLQQQIRTDALTGAYNRLALNEEIQQRFDMIQQHQQGNFAFAMMDVDYFKNYNDEYGHLKGDDILKTLVQQLQQYLPEQSFLARYGGEEFAVIIHDVPKQIAEQIFEGIVQLLREIRLEHRARPDAKTYVSLSVGMAYMQFGQYDDVHTLMKSADQQLYAAKAAGRDQVKCAN